MKKVTIMLLAIAFPVFMIAQTGSVEKLFKKYETYQGFELEVSDSDIDIDNDGNSNLLQFLDDIEKMYVLNFDVEEGDKEDLKTFTSKLNKLIEKGDYTSVIDISSEEKFRLLLRKGKDDKVIEVLMLMEGDDESSFIFAAR